MLQVAFLFKKAKLLNAHIPVTVQNGNAAGAARYTMPGTGTGCSEQTHCGA